MKYPITLVNRINHGGNTESITMFLEQFLDTKGVKFNPQKIMLHLDILPSALSEIFAAAAVSGSLTVADRYGLLAALLKETLTPEEGAAIDRLLHGVRRGRVTLVENLSSVRSIPLA